MEKNKQVTQASMPKFLSLPYLSSKYEGLYNIKKEKF